MNIHRSRESFKVSVITNHLLRLLRISVTAIFVSALLMLNLPSSSVAQASQLSPNITIPPGYSSELIHIKFRDGTRMDVPEAMLPRDAGNSVEGITSLFSLPQDKLDEIKATGETFMREESARDGAGDSLGSLPNLGLWFQVTLQPGTDAAAFIEQVRALDQVEIVEPAPLPLPPPAITPNFTGNQGYLNVAPGGIDAIFTWNIPGGNGSGVTIFDVEYNWLQTHEDLSKANGIALLLSPGDSNSPPGYSGCPAPCNSVNREHGTAVLGEMIANPDTKGVTGISWGANIGLAPTYTTNRGFNPANAILLAMAHGKRGDVILIEQQTPVCGLSGANSSEGPEEWISSVFDAIRTATANGFVVVEAAGNGNVNLDQAACGNAFNRSVRDSGAIIVGAGLPPASGSDRQRAAFSSYGSRVDVQGWGEAVVTTGYGDGYSNAADPNNPNFWYTNFSGTSSASPIVAGAVANLQGIALNRSGIPLTPLRIRALLVGTGSPQLGNTAQHIGPRPNLRMALAIPGGATTASPSGAISDTTPTYTWNKVSNATWYYLWVNGPSGNVTKQWYEGSAVCGANTCSATPTTTLTGGNYTWWIQTWSAVGFGYGPWSTGRNFSLATLAPPGAATTISPSGSITVNTPTYTWNSVNGATWYYLWVNGPSGTVIKQWYEGSAVCSASTCSVTPGITLSPGNHQWWIQTWNNGGFGPWSSAKNFSLATIAPPGAATLVSPSGSTTDITPTYTWNKVSAAAWYYLWVNGPGGTRIKQWFQSSAVCGATTCSVTPNVPLGSGNHQWWILTWNEGGAGPWSSAKNFSLP